MTTFEEHLKLVADYYNLLGDVHRAKVFTSGVGKAVEAERKEFGIDGSSQRLRELESKLDKNVLDTFKKVFGVGPRTALRWYSLGYRNLSDIKCEVTSAQGLGLKHNDDLQKRIPRKEMDSWNHHLGKLIPGMMIVGSYRRGTMDSGDVDVLVVSDESMEDLARKIQVFIVGMLALGPRKFMGLVRLKNAIRDFPVRRLDVRLFSKEELPFALLYNTGSQNLNIQMRNKALSMGYKLSEYSLIDEKGEKISIESEKEIFEALGMKYLEPENRNL